MLNTKTSIEALLNPCKISSSARSATYTQSEASSYTSSQEIRFSLPQESLDLSNAFLDMSIQLKKTDDEVPLVVLIDSVANPGVFPLADTGSFKIKFDDSVTPNIPFDTLCEDLETIMRENLKGLTGRGFEIVCADVGAVAPFTTGTNRIIDGVQLVISNFTWDVLPDEFDLEIINNSFTLAGVPVPLFLNDVQTPEFAYPRLEASNPIISSIRVDIGGENIINISQIDVLSSIVSYMQKTDDRYYTFELGSESNNGIFKESAFLIKLNLTDYMSLFRKVLPLDLIQRHVRIYLTLNSPKKCLITKNVNDGADYTVSNVEFHYNVVKFTEPEKQQIQNALDNNQLIIPYIGFSNYSKTLAQGTSAEDIPFNPSCSALLGIMAVMQPQDYISDSRNKRKSSTFLKNKLFSARLKTGTEYHPRDIIKSIETDKSDVSEYIEEFINVAPFILSSQTRDMKLFYNYVGNYVGEDVYVSQWQDVFPPTFVIGISTAGTPHDNFGHICDPGRGYSGLNTSNMSDVRLELKGLELRETTLVQIFSIEQQYLVFGNNFFRRIR